MEAALLPRALARDRSLISTHPALDEDLVGLGAAVSDCVHHNACPPDPGASANLWCGRGSLVGEAASVDYDGRSVFYAYWDNVGLAVATAVERRRAEAELADLRQTAFNDRKTGLPNAEALERQLDAHAGTWPFSVLVLDFDGLRAANTAFGYTRGGDALIKAVGQALPGLADAGELPFRLHTAGDESCFCCPSQDTQNGGEAPRGTRDGIECALCSGPVRNDLPRSLCWSCNATRRRDARTDAWPCNRIDALAQSRAAEEAHLGASARRPGG